QPVVRIDEDEASVAVEVARAEGQDGPASVRYRTRAGTAGDGEDFQGVAGLLTWDDGEAGTRRIEIPLFGDRLEEGDETLTVELTDYAGARAGAQRAAEITLLDDIYLRPAEGRIASGGCTCLQPPPDRGPGSAWAPLAWLVAGFGLVRARRRPRAEASGSRS
ncbi:MAG: Calx-beta domain-containing protein, partial [Myxococcota bacterium]